MSDWNGRTEKEIRERIARIKRMIEVGPDYYKDAREALVDELEWVLSSEKTEWKNENCTHYSENTACSKCITEVLYCKTCKYEVWDKPDQHYEHETETRFYPSKEITAEEFRKATNEKKEEEDCCGNYDNGDCLGSLCECECHKEVSSAPKERRMKKNDLSY